ncbi:aspartic proteinase 36-like [Zingiber officinale]|uniref:aspartic proteinase 36-like n=1 Tax=Zingiber officinale TaxID=94328 RepID=UPI001C4CA8A2|nr:aspartic proteinase 36-like [Zingiber officinale]
MQLNRGSPWRDPLPFSIASSPSAFLFGAVLLPEEIAGMVFRRRPMRIPQLILLLLVASAAVVFAAQHPAEAFKAGLRLERTLPTKGVHLDHLRARDRSRHGRSLLGTSGVVDFPVEGSANPFTVGLYYTRVRLGNPAKDYYVQIDTGSDALWVVCSPCDGCPSSSELNIQLNFYEPDKSSTSTVLTCSDDRCNSALQIGEAMCPSASSSDACSYSFKYGDGSGTAGYYVYDTIYFDTITGNQQPLNSSAQIVFGCSSSQSGDLTKSDKAVGGIFGFGQNGLSVISQLSATGVVPSVFSHCLRGSESGGGILVLGEIVEPGIVYTPLVPSQPHYNVNLESIAVNGHTLSIDSSVFTTTNTQGTIVDSGTTLAYLAEQAYEPFVNAIVASVSSSVRSVPAPGGNECFVTSSSLDESFPSVTLNFKGGASLSLNPEDYLLQQGAIDNTIIWCIGFQNNQGSGITILGDLVLKDKIVVYDLANQRIGWRSYDCSQSVNVSTSPSRNQFLNTGQFSINGASHIIYHKLLWTATGFLFLFLFFM